ncbi:hypothetical protein DFH06DRAFT_1195791 [Mycena polygramma]|nr:hypothetical protein DFH06DRAFT_1195791 [Mycena polygramma]
MTHSLNQHPLPNNQALQEPTTPVPYYYCADAMYTYPPVQPRKEDKHAEFLRFMQEWQPSFLPEGTRYISPFHKLTSMLKLNYPIPPIHIRIETRLMSWQAYFLTITSPPTTLITMHDGLISHGEIIGHWVIEGKLCSTDRYVLIRVKNRIDHTRTIFAMPYGYSELPDPDDQTQIMFHGFTQGPSRYSSMDMLFTFDITREHYPTYFRPRPIRPQTRSRIRSVAKHNIRKKN